MVACHGSCYATPVATAWNMTGSILKVLLGRHTLPLFSSFLFQSLYHSITQALKALGTEVRATILQPPAMRKWLEQNR